MLVAMLASVLLAQQTTRYDSKMNDVKFMCAVEQSLAMWPNASPPEPFRTLIENLGSECYTLREWSYDRLAAAFLRQPRWLFWGLMHPDITVQLYCNKALWRISECHACYGTGECQFEPSLDSDGEPYEWCSKCTNHRRNHRNITCDACAGEKRFWVEGVKGSDGISETESATDE